MKNILIADSGSTKTDWVLLDGEHSQFIQTEGLNPHLLTATEFIEVLTKELKPNLLGKDPAIIHFFGAGCGLPGKKKEVKKYLDEVFQSSEINVRTDLDGAGLALFGDKEGIVCILGSGSSAGFYRGGKIVEQMPSFGYPHGDEGSGSYIGKRLIEAYLNKELDPRLTEFYEAEIDIKLEKLFYLLQIPREAKLFVSKVCKVFSKKTSYTVIQKIIDEGFALFLENVKQHFAEQSKKNELGFVGSVASEFEGELRAAAKQKDLQVYSVIRSPIEHLALHFSG